MESPRISIPINGSSYYEKYRSLTRYANEYRKLAKNPAAMAGLALTEIRNLRKNLTHSVDDPASGRAFIVRQFKRPEEIGLMRRVYGGKFLQVSAFGSSSDRRKGLIEKIKVFDSSPKSDADLEKQAIELIDIDHKLMRKTDVFHLGDVFVDGINKDRADATIRRFVRSFFGDNSASPNRDEYGLYTAAAAALRSADLSRQVGSAIFNEHGDIISMGCNEVPKAGGGTYWNDSELPIFRDIERGTDANQQHKAEMMFDLVERLCRDELLASRIARLKTTQAKVDAILREKSVRESQVMDIIEYGRMIHAEMAAIIDAARLGRSTSRCTMYCTTFPCHLCAKHIVAAGICRLVFLEPYPKSHAQKLHDDSISFDSSDTRKVQFCVCPTA